MKAPLLFPGSLHFLLLFLALGHPNPVPGQAGASPFASAEVVRAALGEHKGAVVLHDVASGQVRIFGAPLADRELPPCSTFKIWNTLIGLEEGILQGADDTFWKWDGVKREVVDWNRDLTLGESFRYSCVPAYQALARRIGTETMKKWIERINYGDKNLHAGLDVFWLPAQGRETLLITPRRQAALLADWSAGKLPFRADTNGKFRDIFLIRHDAGGKLFGKTGSGMGANGAYALGWFVGVFESAENKTAFACVLQGEGLSGRDARGVIGTIFPPAAR